MIFGSLLSDGSPLWSGPQIGATLERACGVRVATCALSGTQILVGISSKLVTRTTTTGKESHHRTAGSGEAFVSRRRVLLGPVYLNRRTRTTGRRQLTVITL